MQFHRIIFVVTLLVACPSFMVAQDPFTGESKLTKSEAESLVRDLALQEEALAQSCHRIAAVYREMAVSTESASLRDRKLQYERLAENEEKAAANAKRIATHYDRVAAQIHNSLETTKARSLLSDSAYRR